jgi:IS1 family transposase
MPPLVMKKTSCQLTLQLDEMWSFVKNKRKKQWLWIALDQKTREIVGLYIGDRSKKSASDLWQSLPPVYRLCAVCYTDFWESYSEVLPFKRHRTVGKQSGKTSYIERLNNTLRQRISHLVRKTLSFSKKLPNHIGAIFNFVHHYNSCIRKRYHYCA